MRQTGVVPLLLAFAIRRCRTISLVAALAATCATNAAFAQPQVVRKLLQQSRERVPSFVCEEARDVIETSKLMLQAMRNAFGKVSYESSRNADPENCLYPAKFLRFDRMDLLVTLANEPGELCNLCTAKVSAHFLRNRPGTPKVLARHINFARIGPTGDPGTITAIDIGNSEGIAFEFTTEYAGITYKDLRLFVFEKHNVVELKDDQRIPTGFNNEDHIEDKRAIVDANGVWKIDPRRPRELAIDYTIKIGERTEKARVVWTRNGNRLVRKGEVPRVLLEEPEDKAID
jgi:hypothetical protein